jgi:hypothetical protein
MRNISEKNAVKNIKTPILCSVTLFFPPENRAIYEIVWKNNVQRRRIACWVP